MVKTTQNYDSSARANFVTENGRLRKTSQQYDAFAKLYFAGYSLIPLSVETKKPLVAWKEFQRRQPNGETVKQWVKQFRNYNWALLTGSPPESDFGSRTVGLIALDADDDEAIELVESCCPTTPLIVDTGRGGRHYVYRKPTEYPYLPNRQKTVVDGRTYNLDVRGDGGYIAAPMSVHASGKTYKWREPWTEKLIAAAPVYDPKWIKHESTKNRKATVDSGRSSIGDSTDHETATSSVGIPLSERAKQAKDVFADKPGAKQGEGADNYCFALAVELLWGFALDAQTAADVLYGWGQRSDNVDDLGNPYPWSRSEIDHKIHDALSVEYGGTVGDRLDYMEWAVCKAENIVEPFGGKGSPSFGTLEIDGAEIGFDGIDDVLAKAAREEIIDPYIDDDAWRPLAESSKPKHEKYRFAPLSSAEFDARTYRMEWLINRILVKDQPCIVGGPKKSLKTSVLIDMVISLGSGLPFLGKWQVRPSRCVLISGESGGPTIQETARRICKSKGVTLATIDVGWDFRLPKLSVEDELEELTRGLARERYEVAVIDPLYLCLLSGGDKSAANLYDMGPLLLEVSQACLSAGATPILAHHARKNRTQPYQALDLEDLSFAGVQEFARQWILLNRRSEYVKGSGYHDIWLSCGGSVGHSGLWGVNVQEGPILDDFSGRYWNVEVLDFAVLKERTAAEKQQKAEDKESQLDSQLLNVLKDCDPAPTKTELAKLLGWRQDKTHRVLSRLLNSKSIETKQEKRQCGATKRLCDVVILCNT